MSLVKSKGNMYPWVTHTHTHLRGECQHKCKYCYVQAMERGPYGRGYYTGPLRLDSATLNVKYGSGKTIFIDNCNDLFADDVSEDWIMDVLCHCCEWPDNTYVFQSKNTFRMWDFSPKMPTNNMVGTTVESDIRHDVYAPCVPDPMWRLGHMLEFVNVRTFITVEPILRMRDPVAFARAIAACKPTFVNIGADSKGTGLPEPTAADVRLFIDELKACGVEIRQKTNLERLMK